MKKNLLFIFTLLSVVRTLQASNNGVLPGKGGDDFQTLKNSTLIVVLLEENKKYEDKLTKQHKPALVTAYQNAIKTVNDNMQATADKYLKLSKGVEYKTMSEIISLPASTREGYSFLMYDRSMQFAAGTPDFKLDLYSDKEDELKAMLDGYLDYIQFDCADPKYHGEEDYRRVIILIKGKKKTADAEYMQSLDMIIPTKGSFALCFMTIQNQFNSDVAGEKKVSKQEEKEEIRRQVAKARTKTLVICKDNLEKNITQVKISAVFKYKFKLVSREDFDNAILNNDTSCCVLVVYPADKVQGGYRPTVSYQHLIIDAQSDDILLTVIPEATGAGAPPSYQKITDKHFKDIVKTEDDITK